VPLPDVPKEAPVPTVPAIVVFVPDVMPLNATLVAVAELPVHEPDEPLALPVRLPTNAGAVIVPVAVSVPDNPRFVAL
jgi:hypothetical protein